jgi:hypothetical protein
LCIGVKSVYLVKRNKLRGFRKELGDKPIGSVSRERFEAVGKDSAALLRPSGRLPVHLGLDEEILPSNPARKLGGGSDPRLLRLKHLAVRKLYWLGISKRAICAQCGWSGGAAHAPGLQDGAYRERTGLAGV